jgi:asparagine N-glycosylation enzyme membrane subunit Stt3
MTWVNDIPAKERGEVLTNMQQMYDAGWRVAALFIPSASKALAGVVLKPLGLLVAWLVYGVLAFVTARLLGGRGSLGVTYGATALAASPQLLSIFQVIPGVNLAGLGIWAVICNYLALKHTHDLSPGRTFWATVMPYLILILLVMLLASFVGVLTAMRFANGLPAIGGGA